MINYKKVFEALPRNYVLFDINEPVFTILDMSDSFLKVLGMTREDVIGKPLFVVFPPNKLESDTTEALKKSLNTVLTTSKYDAMPVVRYDIQVPGTTRFDVRYWRPENYPLLQDGKLVLIIHTAIDLTAVQKQVNFKLK